MPRPKGSINKIKRKRSMTVSLKPRQEIWIDKRTGISNEDIPAVLNVPGSCSRALWYDKKGYEKDFDDTQSLQHTAQINAHMREVARLRYVEESRRLIRHSPKDYRSNLKRNMIAFIPDIIINKRAGTNYPLLLLYRGRAYLYSL